MYEVCIKRRFWFGYQKYQAVAYKTETLGNTARLSMVLPDGCRIAIPKIDRRLVKVYPRAIAATDPDPTPME